MQLEEQETRSEEPVGSLFHSKSSVGTRYQGVGGEGRMYHLSLSE